MPEPTPSWRYGQKLTDVPKEPVVTFELYDKVTIGMPYETVAVVFGRPGREVAFSRINDISNGAYKWENPDGSYAQFHFSNGKVSIRSNFNLR